MDELSGESELLQDAIWAVEAVLRRVSAKWREILSEEGP
jgi:hypothetical protein